MIISVARSLLGVIFVLGVFSPPVRGGQAWHQFRGPLGNGHASQESQVPLVFSAEQGLVWQQSIPGTGWSSPVLDQGQVWLTTAEVLEATAAEKEKWVQADPKNKGKTIVGTVVLKVVCLDADTGEVRYQRTLEHYVGPDPIHATNSYASPTPVLDGSRIYCHFGNYGTWCLEAVSGETLWHAQIPLEHGVGPGSSPFVYQDRLILVCDGMDAQFITALDKHTGQTVWRTDRPPMLAADNDQHKAYSSPLLIDVDGQPQLVIPGAQWICAYEPQSGAELWRADHGSGFSTVPMAVYEQGLVVFSTGYTKPELVAVDPTGNGDVTETHVRWRMNRQAPTKPSPLGYQGRVYIISDGGVFSCIDALTGEIRYQQRVPGNYSASPILAGGHIFLANQSGVVTVVRPGDTFHQVAVNTLDAAIMASPAVWKDDLVVRTAETLYRFSAGDTN